MFNKKNFKRQISFIVFLLMAFTTIFGQISYSGEVFAKELLKTEMTVDTLDKNTTDTNTITPSAIQMQRKAVQALKISGIPEKIKVGNKIELKVLDNRNNVIPNSNIVFSVSDEKIGRMDDKTSNKFITLSSGTIVITAAFKNNPGINGSISLNIEENIKEVYMRVEGYDKTILERTKIRVPLYNISQSLGNASGSSASKSKGWDVGKFDNPTNAHAIVYALTEVCKMHQKTNNEGDLSNNFDFQDYGWSLYIAMIGGDREHNHKGMSGWMYRVNDALPNVGCQGVDLKDGDEIVWYYGAFGFDNVYTKLSLDKKQIAKEEKVKIRIDGYTGGFETIVTPLKGATILVNGEEYKNNGQTVITDDNGNAEISFSKSGDYKISATRYRKDNNVIDIVRPVPSTLQVR